MKNLKPNFFFQLTTSLLQTVTPILTFPYVSRILGPDKIGKINFIDFTIQFLLVVSAFGIPMYGMRAIAQLRNNKTALRTLVSELICIHIVTTFICFGLFAIVLFVSPEAFLQPTLLILAFINLAANAFTLDWLIQGLEDFAYLSARTIIIRLLVVVSIFLVVKQEQDFALYYTLLVAGSLLFIGSGLYYAFKNNLFLDRVTQPWKHVKPLAIFFSTTAAISVYTFLDTFILGIVAGSVAVGYYTTALKTVKLSQNFVNDLGGVLLPRISHLHKQEEHREIQRLLDKSLFYVITIAVPLCIFFIEASPEIIAVLAGTKYKLSITTLQILAPLPLIIGLSNVFGIQVLIPFQQEKGLLLAVSAGSIVSIVTCIILCPLYKQNGAAWACLLAETVVTGIVFLYARKLNKFQVSIREWALVLVCSLLFIPIVEASRYMLHSALPVLVTSVIACSAVYLLLQQFVFSNKIIKESVQFAATTMGISKNKGSL